MFLPLNAMEMKQRGWDSVDFVYVSGEAYVDHPSFGHAIVTRLLEAQGFRVGFLSQPDWRSARDFTEFGKPKLGFLVSSGVIDSMVNHYTAAKKKRSEDVYSPGGKAGRRPDRAVIVYCSRIREAYGEIPVLIGGVEASLRRFAHYDYWDDKVRRSVLIDSQADILMYGMGERSLPEIAARLRDGEPVSSICDVRGTCWKSAPGALPPELKKALDGRDSRQAVVIPGFEETAENKAAYASAFKVQYDEQDPFTGKTIIQPHGQILVVQNPPSLPLNTEEMDRIYALPYERAYHPSYESIGGVPAIREVEFSITAQRGCYGGCAFCSLHFHQGRIIQARSDESIVDEARGLTRKPEFKGYIHDVGGPTANFRKPACSKQMTKGACKHRQCLWPEPCPKLEVDHQDYLNLLRRIRKLPGIKKVFVRSGIRYDYLMLDKNESFFRELCEHHVSGQLKVAPEHVSDPVLYLMGKPGRKVYEKFSRKYHEINKKMGKDQYLVPYLISSHPGSSMKSAVEMALYLKETGHMPEQVQDFYPTPGTLSTCMYYTGVDPRNMKPVFVAKDPREKAMQRALLQYRKKENYAIVKEALHRAGRDDLVSFGKEALVRPTREEAVRIRQLAEEKSNRNGKRTPAGREKSLTGKKATGTRREMTAGPVKRKAAPQHKKKK